MILRRDVPFDWALAPPAWSLINWAGRRAPSKCRVAPPLNRYWPPRRTEGSSLHGLRNQKQIAARRRGRSDRFKYLSSINGVFIKQTGLGGTWSVQPKPAVASIMPPEHDGPMQSLALDASLLTIADARNLALQRTSALKSLSLFGKRFSPSYHLWARYGSNLLINAEVSIRKRAIIAIAAQEIAEEFECIIAHLGDADISSIMDIGCGLGIIDVLFAKTGRVSKLALVDIEETSSKHHGFAERGAGYNSLATSRKLVAANVADGIEIATINPNFNPMTPEKIGRYGLIMSLISCGFHYPAMTYSTAFKSLLQDDGAVLLDLRDGIDHSAFLAEFRIVAEIANSATHRRVLLKRY